MRRLQKAGFLLLTCAPAYSQACWEQAAQRYGVPAQLLYAIARVESNLNSRAVNGTHSQLTHSYDIGLMQINSSHLNTLAQYGIYERDLFDPCTNIYVGAWLLARCFERHGATWNGVGAYNAACTRLKEAACQNARINYAWLVYRQLPSQQSAQHQLVNPEAKLHHVVAPFMLAARVSP